MASMSEMRALFPAWDQAKFDANFYVIRCMAQRLRKWGFEPIVNKFDAQSMYCLATLVHEPLASALRREAAIKEAADG